MYSQKQLLIAYFFVAVIHGEMEIRNGTTWNESEMDQDRVAVHK